MFFFNHQKPTFMRRTIHLTAAVLASLVCSQTQAQLVVEPPNTLLGNSGFDEISNAITEDQNGNIYITGTTTDYLDTEVPGKNPSGIDAFVAKYDQQRNLLWVRQIGIANDPFGGPGGTDRSNAVSVDSQGNVYIAGSITEITPFGGPDAFLAKYDTNGVLQWLESFDGIADGNMLPPSQVAFGVAAAPGGIIYLTGQDQSSAFLAKYTDVGNQGVLTWIELIEAPKDGPFGFIPPTTGNAVSLGPDDAIYVTGSTNGYVGDANNPQNSNAGSDDLVVAKYIDNGNSATVQWIRQIGTAGSDIGNGLAATTGDKANTVIFVAGTSDGGFGGTTGSFGGDDAFLAKYNAAGELQWDEQFGTPFSDEGLSVAVNSNGSIYLAGSTNGIVADGSSSGAGPDAIDAYLAMFSDSPDAAILEHTAQVARVGDFISNTVKDIGRGVSATNLGTVLITGETEGKDNQNNIHSDAFIVALGLLGDVNCDGQVNLLDVQPFVDLLTSGGYSAKADINGDGAVDLLDVGPFVDLISG